MPLPLPPLLGARCFRRCACWHLEKHSQQLKRQHHKGHRSQKDPQQRAVSSQRSWYLGITIQCAFSSTNALLPVNWLDNHCLPLPRMVARLGKALRLYAIRQAATRRARRSGASRAVARRALRMLWLACPAAAAGAEEVLPRDFLLAD